MLITLLFVLTHLIIQSINSDFYCKWWKTKLVVTYKQRKAFISERVGSLKIQRVIEPRSFGSWRNAAEPYKQSESWIITRILGCCLYIGFFHLFHSRQVFSTLLKIIFTINAFWSWLPQLHHIAETNLNLFQVQKFWEMGSVSEKKSKETMTN